MSTTTSTTTTTPFPTRSDILSIFHPLSQAGQSAQFFAHVADDVDWTIKGHTPMSRRYDGKDDFVAGTLKVLGDRVLTEPLRMRVTNVTVGGGGGDEQRQAVVELEAVDAVCRNGLKYDMTYCWVLQFGADRKIVKVRAYLDSDLLTRAIEQNQG